MSLIRNWQGSDPIQFEGQAMIHEMGWRRVLVKRTEDIGQNVGVSSEVDEQETTFEIKARLDTMTNNVNTTSYIGLVEQHILPLMSKGDRWYTQNVSNKDIIEVYRIISIDQDEIILTREY